MVGGDAIYVRLDELSERRPAAPRDEEVRAPQHYRFVCSQHKNFSEDCGGDQ